MSKLIPAALVLAALAGAPCRAQNPLVREVQEGLEKEVEKGLPSFRDRATALVRDLFGGATVEEAVSKQIESTAIALTLRTFFLPAVDALSAESRTALERDLRNPASAVVQGYAARGFAAYCQTNQRDCACLEGRALSQKLAADLWAEMRKRPFTWIEILQAAGGEAMAAKATVRLSVFLASEMVHAAAYAVKNHETPASFCAALQRSSGNLDAARLNHALDQALSLAR